MIQIKDINKTYNNGAYEDVNDYVDEVCKNLLPLIIANGGVDKIKGIGIGAPNGNYYSGTIEFAPNLPWKGVIPLAAMFEERLGIPTALTNDANAAGIGEMTYGAARGMKDFIMITLGTGVGSGIVINGQMVYGHDGFAGELGHTIIRRENGRLCGCGRHGCLDRLEDIVSRFCQTTEQHDSFRTGESDEVSQSLTQDGSGKLKDVLSNLVTLHRCIIHILGSNVFCRNVAQQTRFGTLGQELTCRTRHTRSRTISFQTAVTSASAETSVFTTDNSMSQLSEQHDEHEDSPCHGKPVRNVRSLLRLMVPYISCR